MSAATSAQKMAQVAYANVAHCHQSSQSSKDKPNFEQYRSFARSFPALIHSCGLAQALAFARSKAGDSGATAGEQSTTNAHTLYLSHLGNILENTGHLSASDQLLNEALNAKLDRYIRLSQYALQAATWIKRYAEAYAESETTGNT